MLLLHGSVVLIYHRLPIEVEIIEEHSFEKNVVFEMYLGDPRVADGKCMEIVQKRRRSMPTIKRETSVAKAEYN